MNEYMSGDRLYQYLHISKRKMKYLLEKGYIPVIDTGKKTHRYQVRTEDAEAFLIRMQEHPASLYELNGRFSSRPFKPTFRPEFKLTQQNIKAYELWLRKRFKKLPDVISTQVVSDLTGLDKSYIRNLCNNSIIISILMKGKLLCVKESIITYLTTEETILKMMKSENLKQILNDYITRK